MSPDSHMKCSFLLKDRYYLKVNGNHEIMTQKQKRKFFLPQHEPRPTHSESQSAKNELD